MIYLKDDNFKYMSDLNKKFTASDNSPIRGSSVTSNDELEAGALDVANAIPSQSFGQKVSDQIENKVIIDSLLSILIFGVPYYLKNIN